MSTEEFPAVPAETKSAGCGSGCAGLLVLVLVLVWGVPTAWKAIQPAKAVPDLQGAALGFAEDKLDDVGLDAEVVGSKSFFGGDQVCRQEPRPRDEDQGGGVALRQRCLSGRIRAG